MTYCSGSIQEISQQCRESCKSGAVITMCELLMDFSVSYLSQLQNGLGTTNVAINELFVQVVINPEIYLEARLRN